jgi:hypothetical protein
VRWFWWLGLIVVVPILGLWAYAHLTFPRDSTPAGAYLRIVIAVNRGTPAEFFAYTETDAQHACYTIRDYRRKIVATVRSSYPEPERTELINKYQAYADAPDGANVFALYASQMGWLQRLRHDLSGIEHVEINGDRASVQTARGTRYPFRRRDNGIWGITLFTAALVTEAERAARDVAIVEQAARDYDRAKLAKVVP